MKPDFSLIIVNWNTEKYCRDLIYSIYNTQKKSFFEIILVDNFSRKDSLLSLVGKFPEVKVIYLPENMGYGRACNAGAEAASGLNLIFLNSDIIISEPVLPALKSYFEDISVPFILGCSLINPDKSMQISAFPAPSLHGILLEALMPIGWAYARQKRYQEKLNQKINRVGWVCGAMMAVKTDTFGRIGGFNRKIFMYGEDTDLCVNAARKGFDVVYAPEISLQHVGGASVSNSERTAEIADEGRVAFWRLNYPGTTVFLVRIIYCIRSGIRIPGYFMLLLLKRNPKYLINLKIHFRALLKIWVY